MYVSVFSNEIPMEVFFKENMVLLLVFFPLQETKKSNTTIGNIFKILNKIYNKKIFEIYKINADKHRKPGYNDLT